MSELFYYQTITGPFTKYPSTPTTNPFISKTDSCLTIRNNNLQYMKFTGLMADRIYETIGNNITGEKLHEFSLKEGDDFEFTAIVKNDEIEFTFSATDFVNTVMVDHSQFVKDFKH